ncbi:MAG: Xaa-Pro peptidase family protein [Desulfobacterales bacterium]
MEQRKNFPKEEYDSRISNLQSLMAAQDLAGILLSQAENLIYFSGYRTSLYHSKFRPFFCFIPIEGLPTLVLPILELGLGKQTSYFEDFRCWGNLPGCQGTDPFSLIAEVIKEKGKDHSKIGIELDSGQRMGMNTAQFEELKSLLPDAHFASSAEPVWKLRSIKSPLEIEYMREACRITDKAVEAAVNFVEEGKTEKEMAKVLGTTMLEEGADIPRSLSVSSGVGSYDVLNGLGTARAFQTGDMINFDFGTYYKGYCSDITRSIFVGEPSKRQRDFYEAIKQIQETTCKAAKPGIPISEIDKVAEQAIIESGYRDYMLHRTGHGLGLEVHEPPSIAPGDETLAEEGMVVAIEPGIYDFSIGAFRIEDNIVVTSDGFECLNRCSRELVVK